jgi:hypothetical protein
VDLKIRQRDHLPLHYEMIKLESYLVSSSIRRLLVGGIKFKRKPQIVLDFDPYQCTK